jgi:hypothetical protein
LRQVDSLQEIVEAVKKAEGTNKVLVSQHETSRSAVTLGDEDTEAGTRLLVKVLLNNTHFFTEEFLDDLLYEEATEMIHQLKAHAIVELVSENEIDHFLTVK